MSDANKNENDVFSMMKQYSEDTGVDPNEIFGGDDEPAKEAVPLQESPTQGDEEPATIHNNGLKKDQDSAVEVPPENTEQPQPPTGGVPVSRPGQPNSDVPADVQGGGVVMDTDKFNASEQEQGMVNGAEEEITRYGSEKMNELEIAKVNIDAAKERIGVDKLQIPEMFNHEIIGAALDPDPKVHKDGVEAILKRIINEIPEVVISWLPGRGPDGETGTTVEGANEESGPKPSHQVDPNMLPKNMQDGAAAPSEEEIAAKEPTAIDPTNTEQANVSVIIDKTNLPEVSFTDEEREKITKARTVKLNIVDEGSLKFNVIDEAVDDVEKLMSYSRKFSDNAVAIPASRYRATAIGLSYPEMLDLSYSQEMNNLDGERKKWNIAYEHIKNASIGKFADEDDFLQKTSFIDLDYILWTILCATSMDREIVSITCGKKECHSDYDWLYSPKSLLEFDKIPTKVLEELKATGEASSVEAISENYNLSPLRRGNIVELPHSKFSVCFGHISAYTYLNIVFGLIEEIRENPVSQSRDTYGIPILTILKYMLIPNKEGTGHYKVTSYRTMLDIINGLDEVDFQVLVELANEMTEPYLMSFSIKDTICPKCHTKSTIDVPEISSLLFIIARSLSSVNVTFERPQNS